VSATEANAGIRDVPPTDCPPLPAVNDDLHVIHYSSDLLANCPVQTPPVSAIVVQHFLTGAQMTFAVFTQAECARIPPAEVPGRFAELESEMLQLFADFVAGRPNSVWVHWRMRDAGFGFDVLTQRAAIRQVTPHGIPLARRFDLSNYLVRRYGDDYTPHPRLWNAVRRNLGAVPDLLDEAATAAEWQRGNHAAVLWSLAAKVGALARLFDRVRRGTFLTGACEPGAAIRAAPIAGPKFTTTQAVLFHQPVPPPLAFDPSSGTGTILTPARMTTRHWAILEELYKNKAFDRGSCMSTTDLARAVDGNNGKPSSFKRPVAELRTAGVLDTAEGAGGGAWLTPAGRALIETRRSA
jgi:hypothetical protein